MKRFLGWSCAIMVLCGVVLIVTASLSFIGPDAAPIPDEYDSTDPTDLTLSATTPTNNTILFVNDPAPWVESCTVYEKGDRVIIDCLIPRASDYVPTPPEKYNRSKQFGGWIDADRDGMNTRQEILSEESLIPVATNRNASKVLSGEWLGPYTNRRFTDPGDLQGEHIVSLKEAWMWGAWAWTKKKRVEFANFFDDSDHLLAVHGSTNQSKGARGIADSDRGKSFLPPANKCEFAIARVRVWAHPRWELPHVPQSEKDDTLRAIAVNCPPQYGMTSGG